MWCGVCLLHKQCKWKTNIDNIFKFIDKYWPCERIYFSYRAGDRLSAGAPLNFNLSKFEYVNIYILLSNIITTQKFNWNFRYIINKPKSKFILFMHRIPCQLEMLTKKQSSKDNRRFLLFSPSLARVGFIHFHSVFVRLGFRFRSKFDMLSTLGDVTACNLFGIGHTKNRHRLGIESITWLYRISPSSHSRINVKYFFFHPEENIIHHVDIPRFECAIEKKSVLSVL